MILLFAFRCSKIYEYLGKYTSATLIVNTQIIVSSFSLVDYLTLIKVFHDRLSATSTILSLIQ